MIVLRLQRHSAINFLRSQIQASSSLLPYIRVVAFSTNKNQSPPKHPIEDKTKSSPSKSPKTTALRDLESESSVLYELLEPKEKEPKTTAEKVKRKVENTFLYASIAIAFVVIGGIVYFIYGEMFAPDSPQAIVNKATDVVKNDSRIFDIFGDYLKVYGEETSRGRRRHYAHHRYEKDGQQRMFHIKGNKAIGKGYAEIAYVDGAWQDRFLYVTTENELLPRTIVLIDNR